VTARKSADNRSWDEFWASVAPGRVEEIRGVKVVVPADMPLAVEQRIDELRESSSLDDMKELISLIFGVDQDAFDVWRDAGMGATEFQVVLTWGMANAAGRELSFAEAYDLVKSGAGGLGKATPNRATRRAAQTSRSAAGGGRSARTSAASTASARKSSRA
jgi:hypothetical protein